MTSIKVGWHSVLHLTSGGNGINYGSRTPAILFSSNQMSICSAVNGNGNFCNSVVMQIDLWVDINISQKKQGSDYFYAISVGGKTVANIKNTKPQEFSNVKVYVGDPWYPPMSGYIQDLYIGGKI